MFDSVAYIAASAAVWPLMTISPSRLGGLEFTVDTREVGRLYDGVCWLFLWGERWRGC